MVQRESCAQRDVDQTVERYVENDNELVCLRVKDEAGLPTRVSGEGSQSHRVPGIADGDGQEASFPVGTLRK